MLKATIRNELQFKSGVYLPIACRRSRQLLLQHASATNANQLPVWSRSASAASSYTDVGYQHMQKSKLPTMYFQPSLPRLPIPLLEKTCQRFLAAVEPIVADDVYSATKRTVKEFQQGVGMDLHAKLKLSDEANKQTSYISQPWFDMYLSDRAPLPLNYNPLLVMKSDARPEYRTQIVRAANLIISSLRFWRSLQAEQLEPEVFHLNSAKSDTESYRKWMRIAPTAFATYVSYAFKAFPLDMSQYSRLFGTARIPKLHKDELTQCIDAKHILVLRRGNMYAVNVLDVNGNIEPPTVIMGRLKAVLHLDEQREAASVPLGVLTAGQRDDWARTREHLVSGIAQRNASLLQNEVDGALFVLCLDGPEDPIYDENKPIPMFRHLLAGEARNRWFDKSISLLVCADGTAALNFEHSWGDGVAVLRYFNEIYKETLERPFVSTATVAEAVSAANDINVRAINFELDDKIRAAVTTEFEQNAKRVNGLDMHMLRSPQINKVMCKRFGLSPDSIMQLAFQLAYRQAFNGYVGTYESCSTAAFRHGRTETMRPCTTATKAFCEAILSSQQTQPSAHEMRAMIDKCSSAHGQLTKEAAMGQGFDRHLFALKNTAVLSKMPVPVLYEDPAYQKLNHNIISTSTLSSDALMAGSFGPVAKDGLGIAYSIQNDECGAIVTSYKNHGNSKDFVASLDKAFSDIRNVIEKSKK